MSCYNAYELQFFALKGLRSLPMTAIVVFVKGNTPWRTEIKCEGLKFSTCYYDNAKGLLRGQQVFTVTKLICCHGAFVAGTDYKVYYV